MTRLLIVPPRASLRTTWEHGAHSNMLAILGLRSLYVLLADALHRVKNLQTGLALVLGFVGVKMMLSERFPVPQIVSLGCIVAILVATVALGGGIDKGAGPAAKFSTVFVRACV